MSPPLCLDYGSAIIDQGCQSDIWQISGTFWRKEPTPSQILEIPFDTLRGIGLSNAKTNYVRNVASFAAEHDLSDRRLKKLSDEEIVELLLPIKGVGRWTIEMLLMFSMGREDLFPVDDLGIQQAMCKVYNLNPANKRLMKEEMNAIAENWKPYRTYASLHLWRIKDNPDG